MTVKRGPAVLLLCTGALLLSSCSGSADSSRNETSGGSDAVAPVNTASAAQSAMDGGAQNAPEVTVVDVPEEDVSMMAYQVGDTGPGGGIVFFVSVEPFTCGPDLAAQCNYLEAAPGSSEVRRGWADVPRLELEVDGADATAIGTGWINTMEIIKQGNVDPVTSAAAYTEAYEHNGQTDWYLPSRDEFKTLYEQRDIVGEFSGADYWSSSEVSPNMAWSHYFHQGHPLLPHPKNHYTHLIRPIRAF